MSTRFSTPILLANATALSFPASIVSAITVSLNDAGPSVAELGPLNIKAKPEGSAANANAYQFNTACCPVPLGSLVAVHLDLGHLP